MSTNTNHIIKSGTPDGYGKLDDGEVIILSAAELADEIGVVLSVQAGVNVTVDATDPRNPIVSSTGGGSSVPNFRSTVKPAARMRSVLTALAPPVKPATRVTQSPATMLSGERLAGNMIQADFDLLHTGPIVTATQDAGGNWTNLAGAQGNPDGLYAALTEGIVLVQGTLRGAMATQPSRPSSLTITKVELLFYMDTANILLLTTTWTTGWRIGTLGVPQTLEGPSSANVSNLVTPRIYDITAALVAGAGLTWANMQNMQPFLIGSIVVDVGLTRFLVDAVRLRVTAEETWAL